MSNTEPTQQDNIVLLRERAEQAGELERQLREERRTNALLRTGYSLEDPLVAHLMTTYTGEPTPEAITAFLGGLNIPKPGSETSPVPAAPTTPTFSQETTDHRRNLSADTQPPGAQERGKTDPYDAAFMNKRVGMQQGKSADDAFAEGVAAVMGAGALGDERVIIRPERSGYADPRKYT